MPRTRRDDGFTLAEMLVVVSLLVVVLGAAWAAFSVASRGSALSNRRAFESQEIGAPMDMFERILMQSQDFITTSPGLGPYRVFVRADVDDDQISEEYMFQATSTGQLIAESREGNAPFRRAVWSEHNVNVADGVPFLRYYDSTGNEITGANMTNNVWMYAYSIEITIVAEYDGEPVRSTRRVLLRNR